MAGSLLVARLFGIDIRLHFSWLFIFVLVFFSLSQSEFPSQYPSWSELQTLIVAAVTALLFFCSILAHELSHSLVARRFKMKVSSITLFLLGGVANLKQEPPSARAEFLMAAAGPAMSVLIGVTLLAVNYLVRPVTASATWLKPVAAASDYLGHINLLLAAFNMIPGFPLDGGRVFRSIVWGIGGDRHVATRIAARGGQTFALLFGLVAGINTFGSSFGLSLDSWALQLGPLGFLIQLGPWGFLIAYFLYNAATQSLQQERITDAVGDVKVAQLMARDFRSIPSGTTVGQLIHDLVIPFNLRAVPVLFGTRFQGIVTINDLRKVEQTVWNTTPVDTVMTKASEVQTATPEDKLLTAIERFGADGLPLLPVLERGELVGVLDRDTVAGFIHMRELFGMGRR